MTVSQAQTPFGRGRRASSVTPGAEPLPWASPEGSRQVSATCAELSAIAQIAALAHKAGDNRRRAGRALEAVNDLAPSDGAVLALWDPLLHRHRPLAHFGVPAEAVEYCASGRMNDDAGYRLVRERRVAHRRCDVPGAAESEMIADVVAPAGFPEGVTACLFSDDRYTGVLHLACRDDRPQRREAMMMLAAVQEPLGRLTDVTQSFHAAIAALGPRAVGVIAPGHGELQPLPVTGDGPPVPPQLPAYLLRAIRQRAPRSAGARSLLWDRDGQLHRVLAFRLAVPEPGVAAASIVVGTEAIDLPLTTRELEVLAELVDGHANAMIARVLGISAKTVAHHIERIFDKLGVTSRVEAAVTAVTEGYVLVPDPARRSSTRR